METYLQFKCANCDNEFCEKYNKEEISLKDVPETAECQECFGIMIVKKVRK